MIEASAFGTGDGVAHGFFTREGGHSSGLFASLNCGFGSGDDRPTVAHNRAIVAKTLGVQAAALLTVYQYHSADVVNVEALWKPQAAPEADAMVTDRPGIALGVLSADCTPVLFCDHRKGVIGAAHAGWKGALAGVLEATVQAMQAKGAGPSSIAAAIGPTISRSAYEVGPEFSARFLAADPANGRFFIPSRSAGHFMFDLPAYVAARLTALGLSRVELIEACTYSDERRFFSFRRATHRREPRYGRQISAIALKD